MDDSKIEAFSELLGVRPSVIQFALLMEERLKANDHKGGWGHCSLDYLIGRLKEEIQELDSSIGKAREHKDHISRPRRMNVKLESCDVANFAMMICENIEFEISEKQ